MFLAFFTEFCTLKIKVSGREKNMVTPNKSILIRREILERIAKLIFDETLLLEIDKIPLNMRLR